MESITLLNFVLLGIFFLPAFIANAVPVIVQNIPKLKNWNEPINEKILGSHKTIRGLTCGVIMGTLTAYVLYLLAQTQYFYLALNLTETLSFGFLMSFGALFGDMVESAIKRKLRKAPGESWPFWDGIDYMVGAIIFALPFYIPEFYEIVFLILLAPALSFFTNLIAYKLKLKKVWY